MNHRVVDLVAGARPNFIKIASLIRALEHHRADGGPLRYRLVHTGQHYDARMSGDFFDQLGIPKPDINLEVGSGSQAEQTAAVMVGYEKVLLSYLPAACVVVGDVNSTMAAAITAQKMCVPVAHVEAGIRSGDWRMPEEINRRATDAITNWFFTTSVGAGENLRSMGVSDDVIYFVGNTMIDTLLRELPYLKPPRIWDEASLLNRGYLVLTLHRPHNVDQPRPLCELLKTISAAAGERPIVFPVHPRTAKTLQSTPELPQNLLVISAQPYREFNFLVQHAKAVITDSGGITEEATVLGVPCITLRDTTERPETVTVGTNELVGGDPAAITSAIQRACAGAWKHGSIPELWDGKAGQRTVAILDRLLSA